MLVVRIKRLLNEQEFLAAESTLNLNEMRELYPTIHNTRHYKSTIINLSSRIDVQTHAVRALDNRVTLTFDLLISESIHSEE